MSQTETQTAEIYIGENLDMARCPAGQSPMTLSLDGREFRNPAAYRRAPAGVYVITRTEGVAPGDVAYYGYKGAAA